MKTEIQKINAAFIKAFPNADVRIKEIEEGTFTTVVDENFCLSFSDEGEGLIGCTLTVGTAMWWSNCTDCAHEAYCQVYESLRDTLSDVDSEEDRQTKKIILELGLSF